MEVSRWYVRALFARVPPEYELTKNRTLEECEGIRALLRSADLVDFAEPEVALANARLPPATFRARLRRA